MNEKYDLNSPNLLILFEQIHVELRVKTLQMFLRIIDYFSTFLYYPFHAHAYNDIEKRYGLHMITTILQ